MASAMRRWIVLLLGLLAFAASPPPAPARAPVPHHAMMSAPATPCGAMQDCCRHICLGCALEPEAPPGPAVAALARPLPPVAIARPAPIGRLPGLDPPPPRVRG